MLLKKDNLQASPQDIALLCFFCFCRCLFVFLGSCVFCFRGFQTNLVSVQANNPCKPCTMKKLTTSMPWCSRKHQSCDMWLGVQERSSDLAVLNKGKTYKVSVWRKALALGVQLSHWRLHKVSFASHPSTISSTSKISIFHHIPSPETGIGCKEELGRVCNRSFSSVLLRPPRGTPLWSQHRPCMTTQAVEVGLKTANDVNLIEHNLWDIVVSVWPVWRGWRNQANQVDRILVLPASLAMSSVLGDEGHNACPVWSEFAVNDSGSHKSHGMFVYVRDSQHLWTSLNRDLHLMLIP
jgi:hypothetical protein